MCTRQMKWNETHLTKYCESIATLLCESTSSINTLRAVAGRSIESFLSSAISASQMRIASCLLEGVGVAQDETLATFKHDVNN